MRMEERFFEALAQQDAVLVRVESTQGSVPREAGAWMAVLSDQVLGTIGGGHLEYQALATARALLADAAHPADAPGAPPQRYALGPSLGQCCGGEVVLRYESVTALDVARLQEAFAQDQLNWPPVALFGGGHVGRALVPVRRLVPGSPA